MLSAVLIICPLLFLAGLVDAIGGGGGLISLPAYLFAGVPVHSAIATNKLSSSAGTLVATARLLRKNRPDLKIAVLSVCGAMAGSFAGAKLSLFVPDDVLLYIMLIVLPVCAFFVLNKKLFADNPEGDTSFRRLCTVAVVSAAVIGTYDGFYGPGTGTFLIIAFTVFARMPLAKSNSLAKVINLSSNLAALAVYIIGGNVNFTLGAFGMAANMLGAYFGAGLAVKHGSKIVRASIITVLCLLLIKVLFFR